MKLRTPSERIRLDTHRVIRTCQWGHVTVGKVYSSHSYAIAYRRHGRLDWRLHSIYRTSARSMDALAALEVRAAGASLAERAEDEATEHKQWHELDR